MSPRRWPVAEPTPWDLAGTAPRIATTPTTADLYAYHGGKGQLLTVKDAADRLKVGTWAIYRLCKSGALPHVRIVDSIRVRPADLAVFVAANRSSGSDPPSPS